MRLFDKLDSRSREQLGIAEEMDIDNREPSIIISLHPKLKEDLDEYGIVIFMGLIPVYASCGLTSKEKRIINGNWVKVREKFLAMIAFHLEVNTVEVANRPGVIKLAPIETQESLAGLASELGKGLHLFDQTLIPYYARFVLSDDDKRNILNDLENVAMSFRSLLLSCAGREMDDTGAEEV